MILFIRMKKSQNTTSMSSLKVTNSRSPS